MSFILASTRLSEKTLKFNNIRVDKNKFHESKLWIHLSLVTVDQIVVSDKFKHNDDDSKYFIGYQKGEIVRPLCIIYLKWVDKLNTLKTVEKTCLF